MEGSCVNSDNNVTGGCEIDVEYDIVCIKGKKKMQKISIDAYYFNVFFFF